MTDDRGIPGDPGEEVAAIPVAEGESTGATGESLGQCAQCGCDLTDFNQVPTENAVFCVDCYRELKRVLADSLAAQSQGINYPMAVVGGLAGGLLGALVWWGFTVLTNIMFGLIAVLIGWAVGKGVVIMSGHKRSGRLQVISVVITGVFYLMANYWVQRTSILEYYESIGQGITMPLFPMPGLMIELFSAGFEMFDLVFIAIALWQAYKMPAPFKLDTDA